MGMYLCRHAWTARRVGCGLALLLGLGAAAQPPATTPGEQSTPERARLVDVEVLILGGGRVEGDAEAVADGFPNLADHLEKAGFKAAAGFPKVLRSDSLPGLRPGLWIAVVGLCAPGDELDPLEALKSVLPGTYSKRARALVAKDSCPRFEGQLAGHAELELATKDVRVHVGAWTTTGSHADTDEAMDEGHSGSESSESYLFVVTDRRTGAVAHAAAVPGDLEHQSCIRSEGPGVEKCDASVTREGSKWIVERSCHAYGDGCSVTMETADTVSLVGRRLDTKSKTVRPREEDCQR